MDWVASIRKARARPANAKPFRNETDFHFDHTIPLFWQEIVVFVNSKEIFRSEIDGISNLDKFIADIILLEF